MEKILIRGREFEVSDDLIEVLEKLSSEKSAYIKKIEVVEPVEWNEVFLKIKLWLESGGDLHIELPSIKKDIDDLFSKNLIQVNSFDFLEKIVRMHVDNYFKLNMLISYIVKNSNIFSLIVYHI